VKKVIIGTPIHGGEFLDFRYVDCLIRSIKELHDIELIPVFLTGDLANARNRLVKLCIEDIKDVTDLVFIDSDMAWAPGHLARLLAYDLQNAGGPPEKNGAGAVVGGLYRKRVEQTVGVYGQRNGEKPNETGLLKVDWCGTGFLRASKEALTMLWARAHPYTDEGTHLRGVFAYKFDGQMISEDVFFCQAWRALGGKIFVDTAIKLGHIGPKVYTIQ
jgi:hypothetical protein